MHKAYLSIIKRLAVPMIFLLLFVGLIIAASLLIPGFTVPIISDISIRQRTTVSHSEQILRTVRPLFALSTVEYTYRSVFPYDYFPEDTDYTELRGLYYSEREVPARLREEMELYRFCREMGMEVGFGSYDFAVITTRVKAGYDFTESVWNGETRRQEENESRLDDTEDTPIHEPAIGVTGTSGSSAGSAISSAGSAVPPDAAHSPSTAQLPLSVEIDEDAQGSLVTICLPKPVITELILEDVTSAEYRYPDMEITASEWRRITGYVERRIRNRVEEEGILTHAEERAKSVIRRILNESGWGTVRFRCN